MGPSIPSPPMLDTLLGHSACQWKFLLHVSIIFTNPSRFRNTRTNFQNTPLCLAKNHIVEVEWEVPIFLFVFAILLFLSTRGTSTGASVCGVQGLFHRQKKQRQQDYTPVLPTSMSCLSCYIEPQIKFWARPLSLHNLVSPISGLPTHLYQSHLYQTHLYQTSFLPSSKNGRTHSGKLALTGDPLAGAITHDFCLRQKSFRPFFYCSRTLGRFKVWYR